MAGKMASELLYALLNTMYLNENSKKFFVGHTVATFDIGVFYFGRLLSAPLILVSIFTFILYRFFS